MLNQRLLVAWIAQLHVMVNAKFCVNVPAFHHNEGIEPAAPNTLSDQLVPNRSKELPNICIYQ